MDLEVTGTPVDSGTYWTIPVTVTTGSVTKGARTQLVISPVGHRPPAAAPTARCSPRRRHRLRRRWEDPTGGAGTSTPIVPLAYADWPPAAPVADTLYLRLAP